MEEYFKLELPIEGNYWCLKMNATSKRFIKSI
ncbi:uncharacterized protein METZ01_LOCUS380702, partial [marine metagenome]